jgi:hypothetical protein
MEGKARLARRAKPRGKVLHIFVYIFVHCVIYECTRCVAVGASYT